MERSRSKKIRFVGKKLHFPRMEEEGLSITNAGAATPNQEDLVSRPGRIGPLITKKTPLRKTVDRNYDFDFEDEVGDDALTSLFDENHDRSGVGVMKVTIFRLYSSICVLIARNFGLLLLCHYGRTK